VPPRRRDCYETRNTPCLRCSSVRDDALPATAPHGTFRPAATTVRRASGMIRSPRSDARGTRPQERRRRRDRAARRTYRLRGPSRSRRRTRFDPSRGGRRNNRAHRWACNHRLEDVSRQDSDGKNAGLETGRRPAAATVYQGQRQILARYRTSTPRTALRRLGVCREGSLKCRVRVRRRSLQENMVQTVPGEIFVFPWLCWINDIIPIAVVDRNAKTVRIARPPANQILGLPQASNTRRFRIADRRQSFYVQNLIEELDQPGMVFRRRRCTIYFWPPSPDGSLRTVTWRSP